MASKLIANSSPTFASLRSRGFLGGFGKTELLRGDMALNRGCKLAKVVSPSVAAEIYRECGIEKSEQEVIAEVGEINLSNRPIVCWIANPAPATVIAAEPKWLSLNV